jgi:hypothetical protein
MRFGYTFAISAAVAISIAAGILAGCGGDAPPAAQAPTTDTSAAVDGGAAPATPAAK